MCQPSRTLARVKIKVCPFWISTPSPTFSCVEYGGMFLGGGVFSQWNHLLGNGDGKQVPGTGEDATEKYLLVH